MDWLRIAMVPICAAIDTELTFRCTIKQQCCLLQFGAACRALAIATGASLFTFNLEWVLHKYFTAQLSQPCDCCPTGGALAPANDDQNSAPNGATDTEGGIIKPADPQLGAQNAKKLKLLQNTVRSYTFEIGYGPHTSSWQYSASLANMGDQH